MKKLKLISSVCFLSLLGLFTVVSCTNEESSVMESDFSHSSRVGVGNEVQDYLNNFYGQSFHFGDSIQTSDKGVDYLVTEVILNGENRARGYVATEKSTNKFLYFVDVDRVTFDLYTENIADNTSKIYEDINQLEDYSQTNELDFMTIISRENSNGSNARRRFWGYEYVQGPCNADGYAVLMIQHFTFWIGGEPKPVLGNNGELLIEPCGMR